MQLSQATIYVTQTERRTRALINLTQPLTAKQLARRIDLSADACREVVRELAKAGLVTCLNNEANRTKGSSLLRAVIDERAKRTVVAPRTPSNAIVHRPYRQAHFFTDPN